MKIQRIESADVYIRVKNPKNTFAVLKRYSDAAYETGYNPGLLRLTGISVYSSYYSFITTIAVYCDCTGCRSFGAFNLQFLCLFR